MSGNVQPFFHELGVALTVIDMAMLGSARAYADRIISIANNEKNQADYDQLQQLLAEVDVLQRALVFDWPEDTRWLYEPSLTAGSTNPEAIAIASSLTFGIEVKSPRIREWRNAMGLGHQAISRAIPRGTVEFQTHPKDNPVKDAVAGADNKFESLRKRYPDLLGVMMLIWDNMMHEPISALINPGSGLFTPNTFDPQKRSFSDLDAVIVVPHLEQLIEGPGGRAFTNVSMPFQWPREPAIPYILNPYISTSADDRSPS